MKNIIERPLGFWLFVVVVAIIAAYGDQARADGHKLSASEQIETALDDFVFECSTIARDWTDGGVVSCVEQFEAMVRILAAERAEQYK